MKRSKIATLLLTGALSVSMLAAGAMTAFAATINDDATEAQTKGSSDSATITKKLQYPDGITFEAKSFEFSFASTDAGAPAIPNVSVTMEAVDTAGTAGTNEITGKTGALDLSGFNAPTVKTGTYTYTVAEVTQASSDADTALAVNTENNNYTLKVFKQANGTVNYTIWNGEKKIDSFDDFIYTNLYTERGGNEDTENEGASLVVTKEVTGNYGDKNKEFEFTFGFEKGALDKSNTTSYTARKNGTGEAITLFNGAKFNLADGEKMVFDKIPAGTKVSVTETGVDGYTTTYASVSNGEEGTANTDVLIGEKTNSITVTNKSNDQVITGLALQAAPYVALIGLALAMMAAYVVLRRRAENN